MAKHLKELIHKKFSKKVIQDHFYEELVELLNDEDLMVRLEALEGIGEIMQSKLTSD